MKALGVSSWSNASKLEILTLPNPTINSPDDILVSVKAVALNRSDNIRLTGYSRVVENITLPVVTAAEFAGIIHSVGSNVTKFRTGDKVYGFSLFVHGSATSILHLTPLTRHYIAHIPSSLSFIEAAALPVCISTAMTGIRQGDNYFQSLSQGGLKGKTALVTGGLGGIGSAACQILKHCFGVKKLIVTVSTSKVPLIDELLGKGLVDQIVDYTKENVVQTIGKQKVDFLFDTVSAGITNIQCVKKGGLIVSAVGGDSTSFRKNIPEAPAWLCCLIDIHSWVQQKRAGRYGVVYQPTYSPFDEQLEKDVEKWVGGGKLRPVVGKIMNLREEGGLGEVKAALEMLGQGKGTVGKMVVKIDCLGEGNE